jgi:hypothetical protein
VLVEAHRMESVPPLEEASGKVRDQLLQERYQELLRDYLKALRSKAFIQVAPSYAEQYGNVEY